MRRDNRGFTVVELIVSITLLAVILVPVAGFFTNSFRVQSQTSMKSAITRVSQYIMENFKNKNYLADDNLKDGSGATFKSFVENIRVSRISESSPYEFNPGTVKDGTWYFSYKGVDYKVDIEILGFTTSDISDFEIIDKDSCTGSLSIGSNGVFSGIDNMYILAYEEGTNFVSPNDGNSYKANYPTLVLKREFADSVPEGEKVSLWLTNNGYYEEVGGNEVYNSGTDSQKYIRIVKGFPEELFVYIEGINTLVKEGQEGDGALKAYTKITTSYLGEVAKDNEKRSASELILDARMVISSVNDDKIRDTFEFSFPVNYDYSE